MEENTNYAVLILISIFCVFLVIGGIWGLSAIYKPYKVWAYAKDGEADYARAQYDRQIAVVEASAKKDSATLLAEAEVERAKGVAKANEIVGKSITEDYIKYLYVQGLQTNQMQTVYVPTNGMLPVFDLAKYNAGGK